MIDRDKILDFIKSVGPVVPMQIAKELKIESIFAGAALSELAANSKLKISNTKIGGSPVYYLPDQAPRLADLYKYLNDKDKQAFDFLKEHQVVRDTALTPILRVSFRNIKDFARPVDVTAGQEKILFWKWYLLSDDEVEKQIRRIFEGEKKAEAPRESPVQHDVKPEQAAERLETETKKAEPAVQQKPEVLKPGPEEAREPITPKKKPVQKKLEDEEMLTPLQPQERPLREPAGDSLFDKTKKYFNSKGIDILSVDVIKKSGELDLIITVPSAVGSIRYYCKARAKKKIAETDLAAVFVKGQVKKLPALLVTTGELTKRAKDMLTTDFEGLKVSQI